MSSGAGEIVANIEIQQCKSYESAIIMQLMSSYMFQIIETRHLVTNTFQNDYKNINKLNNYKNQKYK